MGPFCEELTTGRRSIRETLVRHMVTAVSGRGSPPLEDFDFRAIEILDGEPAKEPVRVMAVLGTSSGCDPNGQMSMLKVTSSGPTFTGLLKPSAGRDFHRRLHPLGAFLNRKTISAANIGRVTTAIRSAGRVMKEFQDVGAAEENVAALRQ